MKVYYNEFDPFAAAWLGELMKDRLIPNGIIDTRSIAAVAASELVGFDQCHFFAGIGGWSHALRLARWPADAPVWTGSCPCQPFSAAGKRKGAADDRHLWPEFQRLIAECGPPVVFGEQVASKDGREWLAGIRADLEALGYGVGAADLCAAGVGAPHIRQRLFWVAGAESSRRDRALGRAEGQTRDEARLLVPCAHSTDGRLGDADDAGLQGRCEYAGKHADQRAAWASSVLIPCADGKFRRVPADEAGEPEPALFPLAHGVPNRVGTLRGAGNAIVPQVAAKFVRAYIDATSGEPK